MTDPLSDADRARILAEERERMRVRALLEKGQSADTPSAPKVPPIKKPRSALNRFVTYALLGVGFLFALGLLANLLPDPPKSEPDAPVVQTSTGNTTDNATFTDSPGDTAADSASDTPANEDSIPTLPGGERYDVTAGLSKSPYDFTFSKPTYGKYGETYLGKRFDSDTGADLSVQVNSSYDHIWSLNASVLGADLRAAQWLLPYIASLPFDANDPAESKQWVLDNMGKVRDQHPVERTAYGAKWSLFGNETSISLGITPETLDAWSARQE